LQRRDTARLSGALALAISFAPSLLRRSRREQFAVSAASAGLGAVAGAATEVAVLRLANRIEGGEPAARAVLIGAGGLATLAELSASPVSGVALAGTVARVGGICALVGAVAPVRERAAPFEDPRTAGAALAVGAAAFAGWRQLAKRAGPARVRLELYPAERWPATVSGGDGSVLPRARLDFEGTRFLGTAPAGLPQDPIRVFAGVRSADTIEQRCRLAVEELGRLGAFRRSRILVCSATLRGYVSPIPVEAEEHLSGGDVASVVVQYFDRRTWLMPAKVPVAARTHRELLRALQERLAGLDDPPEVAIYGESLGAWASQNVFRGGGVRSLDSAGVARALWIGTPFFSLLQRRLQRGQVPSDERVGFVRAKELVAGEERRRGLRFVFLSRGTDPVTLFPGLELLWRRPAWLGPGDWTPGVTFVQTVADLMAATRWPGSAPRALAHDYRLEGPLAIDLAMGHGADPQRLAELADLLVRREVERGARLRRLRRGERDG
jgi:uncharacterized membrane protein